MYIKCNQITVNLQEIYTVFTARDAPKWFAFSCFFIVMDFLDVLLYKY